MRRRIAVVGAGNVGTTVAQEVARRDYADVVIVDIVENLPQGIALDINQAGPVLGYEANVVGSKIAMPSPKFAPGARPSPPIMPAQRSETTSP